VSGELLHEGCAVETIDLVKRYPKSGVNAVDGVSFAAAAGEVSACSALMGRGRRRRSGC
jgi:ABC-type Na+ transport system ATPase subunit NatA